MLKQRAQQLAESHPVICGHCRRGAGGNLAIDQQMVRRIEQPWGRQGSVYWVKSLRVYQPHAIEIYAPLPDKGGGAFFAFQGKRKAVPVSPSFASRAWLTPEGAQFQEPRPISDARAFRAPSPRK